MKLLILLTLIGSIAGAVIDEISSTSPDWPTHSELVNVLEQENLPYDIKGGPYNLDYIIPRCRPTTVTKRKRVTYTTTVQVPVITTVTKRKRVTYTTTVQVPVITTVTQRGFREAAPAVTVTESTTVTQRGFREAAPAVTVTESTTVTQRGFREAAPAVTVTESITVTQRGFREAAPAVTVTESTTVTQRGFREAAPAVTVTESTTVTQRGFREAAPAVTVTESTTVTHKHTVTRTVTMYQPSPDSFGKKPIKASRKAKTEDGDDSCIYVGDVSDGYDVLSITADLVAQVLHTLQYYIDLAKGTDLAKAGTAEAFIAGVKLILHIKDIGCGALDDKDPIIGFPGSQNGDNQASLDNLLKLLDFNPFDKANPVTQLLDTILDVLKQLGINNFEALRPILDSGDVVKKALYKAGLSVGPTLIESKGEKELREVLHLVGLPGLANFKGILYRFFKAAGENNFSDNIEDLIAEFKHTPYKGTIAKMDTTNFMDYVETESLLPSYNSTQIEKSIKDIDPKTAKKQYNKLLHDIASTLLNMNKTLDDLIPPFVSLYAMMGGV